MKGALSTGRQMPVPVRILVLVLLLTSTGRAWDSALTNATLVQDAYIESSNPDTTNAAGTSVYMGRDAATVTRAGFFQWQLPKLPSECHSVISASLEVRATANGDGGALELGQLSTNPALTNLTWNAATNLNIVTGIRMSAPLYTIEWGAPVTLWTGEPWAYDGYTQYQWSAYTDTTPTNGLLKFIRESISTTGEVTITLVTGPASGNGSTQRRCYSKEKAAAPPDPPWAPRLILEWKLIPRGTIVMFR